jgi:hypothetical protein
MKFLVKSNAKAPLWLASWIADILVDECNLTLRDILVETSKGVYGDIGNFPIIAEALTFKGIKTKVVQDGVELDIPPKDALLMMLKYS